MECSTLTDYRNWFNCFFFHYFIAGQLPCGYTPIAQSRVIGGQDAKPGAWPWQVGLIRTSLLDSHRICFMLSLLVITWSETLHSSDGNTYVIHNRSQNAIIIFIIVIVISALCFHFVLSLVKIYTSNHFVCLISSSTVIAIFPLSFWTPFQLHHFISYLFRPKLNGVQFLNSSLILSSCVSLKLFKFRSRPYVFGCGGCNGKESNIRGLATYCQSFDW